jgi:CRP-like cAMP-binding protein
MKRPRTEISFDAKAFLSAVNGSRTITRIPMNQAIFRQGDLAHSVFYLQTGKAKVTVVSTQGNRQDRLRLAFLPEICE